MNKMKMLCAAAMFATITLQAQQKNEQAVAAQLNTATVYYGYGAELNHTAKAALSAGLQQIVINNIAANTDANTIQIGCPENVVLLSYRLNTKTETKPVVANPAIQKMQDSVKTLQKQLNAINNDYSIAEDVLNRTTKLIETTLAHDGKKEITSAELIRLVEYYTARVQTLKAALFALSLKRSEVEERIQSTNTRINERTINAPENIAGTKMIGQLILQVSAKSATGADFNISYHTPNAGWLPSYDLRVKTIDNTCKLSYKASVSQSTGIDWKNVKLTLSTGNPNQGSTVPVISPWYVSLYVPALYNELNDVVITNATNKMQNMGRSTIKTAGKDYEQKEEEKIIDPSNVSAYTTLNESQLYTNFEIDLPYDIPSDGNAYSVAIKEENIKASYKHYAVPKLDIDAFLVAQINDWEQLNLLPGNANIVMDNVYIGKSFINPNTTNDTLNLSLGRDKRVTIKRTLVKEQTKTKVHGDTKTETFTYEIVVKNNKKQPISLAVKDQYPLSNVKEVVVTIDNSGNAEVNEEMGTLNWKVTLQPGESKKFRFGYSVKYPKEKSIYNLR